MFQMNITSPTGPYTERRTIKRNFNNNYNNINIRNKLKVATTMKFFGNYKF